MKHADEEAWRRFSWFIRSRDQRCTAREVLPAVTCNGPLQAAHIIGRAHKATKFDPLNVHSACGAHHRHIDNTSGHEAFKHIWAIDRIGHDEYERLMQRGRAFADRREVVTAALATYPPKPKEATL